MLLKRNFSLYHKIESFFSKSYEEKNFLVFFRTIVSLVAIIEIASLTGDLRILFSPSDTIIPQELMYAQTAYFQYLYPLHQFFKSHQLLTYFYQGVLLLYITSLIFLFIGFLTRYTAFLAIILQLLIFKSFPHFNYGYENFLTMSFFYCAAFPTGKYLSVDAKLFKYEPVVKFNYQRVLQIHLCMVYFFSGVAKSLDVKWWNGNSLWSALASVDNHYFSIPPVILLLTGIGTVLLELSYPLLVLYKPTRKYTIAAIIIMHISIGLIMELYAFAALMIVWNVAAFGNLAMKNSTKNAILT